MVEVAVPAPVERTTHGLRRSCACAWRCPLTSSAAEHSPAATAPALQPRRPAAVPEWPAVEPSLGAARKRAPHLAWPRRRLGRWRRRRPSQSGSARRNHRARPRAPLSPPSRPRPPRRPARMLAAHRRRRSLVGGALPARGLPPPLQHTAPQMPPTPPTPPPTPKARPTRRRSARCGRRRGRRARAMRRWSTQRGRWVLCTCAP